MTTLLTVRLLPNPLLKTLDGIKYEATVNITFIVNKFGFGKIADCCKNQGVSNFIWFLFNVTSNKKANNLLSKDKPSLKLYLLTFNIYNNLYLNFPVNSNNLNN